MLKDKSEQQKADFFNRITDITVKVNSAADDLTYLMGNNSTYFTEDDAKNILEMLENITSLTTKVLVSAIDSIAPNDIATDSKDTDIDAMQEDPLDPDLVSKLPDMVIEIIALIGLNSTMKLIKSFGGTTFPIGKGIRFLGGSNAKRLRAILSEAEIKELSIYFDGVPLYLPRCDRALREIRNRVFLKEYHAMKDAGASSLQCMRELPPKYGFTDRYGWELLKKHRELAQSTGRVK
ncbi:hypothetical protein [Citrobacter portucalensis]|uniref:hypothetical protein n=1 Tax=Citrobacter portucalensis TaxID=1639133 RepID=UPI002243ABC9|nr:hypothetical protein [Citrobacter portucalensis]MCW8351236.1 hypothetical protein [Citrobacter portucalensis]MCX9049722.1 hypothetical protein [Citrobacter portucalensis]